MLRGALPRSRFSGDGVGGVLVVSEALSTRIGFRADGRPRGEAFIISGPSDMHFREARKVPKSIPAFD